MRKREMMTLLWLLLSVCLLQAQTTPEYGIRDKTPELKALVNARVVVSPGVTVDSATVLMNKGKIVAVGKAIAIPPDATVIDLLGKTVYPGFVDPYTEYGLEKTERKRWSPEPTEPHPTGTRVGGNAWNDAIHAEQNWVVSFRPDEKESKELMQLGFTTVQSAKMDGVFRGRSFVTLLGGGLPNDLILQPYSLQFAGFNKGSSEQDYPSSLMGSIAMIRQTLYDADWYLKASAAYKLDADQKMPEFNTAVEALAEAKGEAMIFDSDDELSLLRADKISKEFKTPFVYLGSGFEYARIKDIQATGATMILPVMVPKAPMVKTADDELDVRLADLRHWEMAPFNPKYLQDNFIQFAFTTYKLDQKSEFLKSIRSFVKRGLSKETALAALTTTPASICGVDDKVGTLEKGKLANFFVCDGDILEKEATVYSVWIAGKETRFEEIPKYDLRGDYRLTMRDLSGELRLKGEAGNLKGELKLGETVKSLQSIAVDQEKIDFLLRLDTLNLEGVLRFSGQKIGRDLAGDCVLPDGEVTEWSAKFQSSSEEKPDSAKEQEKEELTVISQLTFPNKAFGPAHPPAQENVLIRNATVWTSETEGILENTDVLALNGKFTAVGKNLTPPAGATIVDATGKHVTAGIIDEHSHIAIAKGVNEGSEAVSAEVRIGDVIDPEDINIYRQLAGGVTVSHPLHGSANPIGGQCQVIKLKWGSSAEEIKFAAAAPTIKFALGENVKQSNWGDKFKTRYPQTRMGVETIIKDALQAAREYEAEWKKYSGMKESERQRTIPPRKDIELDALVEVLNSRMFVHCHAYVQTEILMLIRLAEEFGFKIGTFTHVLEGYKVADEIREHGACANSFADWWAYKFEVYEACAYNPALLAERGVITGVNSDDAEMARRLNQEAGKSILYGDMKAEEAIKMVTINPAMQLTIDQYVGSIKVGKDADFVIWSGNPLSTYSVVEQTWIEGRKYFDLDTDKKMRESIREEKQALIQKVLRSGDEESSTLMPGYKKPEQEWHCEDVFDVWRGEQ